LVGGGGRGGGCWISISIIEFGVKLYYVCKRVRRGGGVCVKKYPYHLIWGQLCVKVVL